MAEIRIDAAKAERMIAQILRDHRRLLPADANAVAANICRRLSTAMPTPTNPPLQGYRIISSYPRNSGSEFTAALKEKIADVNYRVAVELWKLVFDRGRDLPTTVADPRLYRVNRSAACYDPQMRRYDQQRLAKLVSEFIDGCGIEPPLYSKASKEPSGDRT